MTIRFLMINTAWAAILITATVFVLTSNTIYLWIPSLVCWNLYGVFCMYALTRSLISTHHTREFWIGTATFSVASLGAVMLADSLYQPTIGRIISDVLVFNIDNHTADQITRLRCESLRNLADVFVASLMTVAGGCVGRFHARQIDS